MRELNCWNESEKEEKVTEPIVTTFLNGNADALAYRLSSSGQGPKQTLSSIS